VDKDDYKSIAQCDMTDPSWIDGSRVINKRIRLHINPTVRCNVNVKFKVREQTRYRGTLQY